MKLKQKTKQAISSLYKPKQTPSNLNYQISKKPNKPKQTQYQVPQGATCTVGTQWANAISYSQSHSQANILKPHISQTYLNAHISQTYLS